MIERTAEQRSVGFAGGVEAKRCPQDYRIGPPDDRVTFKDRDRLEIQGHFRGKVPEVDTLLYVPPRSLDRLIRNTLDDLHQARTAATQAMILKGFKDELNSLKGILTSYPPIPLYRFSEEELRQAQQQLLEECNKLGPCNRETNMRMMMIDTIDQALRERRRRLDFEPKIQFLKY